MKTYKIFLVRHGLTTANLEGRYAGATDVDICEEGFLELFSLKEEYEYPNVGKVYSSPKKRALQTARAIYPEMTPIVVEDLQEYHFGIFENHTFEEIKEWDSFKEWMQGGCKTAPEGGEDMMKFKERIVEGLHSVILDMMKDNVTQSALFTHGGLIRALLETCGLPELPATQWEVKNGTGYTLMINTMLWQNDKKFEVFTPVPYGIDKDKVVADYQKNVDDDYLSDILDALEDLDDVEELS